MPNKPILIVFALFMAACTSQVSRHDIVYFENTCTEAAEILTENSSNFYTSNSEVLLAPGEKAAIASYMLYTESIFEHISDDYKLSITIHDNNKIINRDNLLDRISTTQPKVKGSNRIWVITDTSLCPDSLNKTHKTP